MSVSAGLPHLTSDIVKVTAIEAFKPESVYVAELLDLLIRVVEPRYMVDMPKSGLLILLVSRF